MAINFSNMTQPVLNQKIKNLKAKQTAGTLGTGRTNRLNTLMDYRKQQRNPVTTQPAVAPLNPTNTATAAPVAQPVQSQQNVNTLYPSTTMFEPKNYEGSPLYQFQVKEGQRQLASSLAAKGLTNSGEAIRQELNIPMQAAAQDTDRMTRIASENADRATSFMNNEALRQERAGNNQWDRAYSIASLMASQSPWNAAISGLDNSASAREALGSANSNYLKDAYGRVISSGGGGGSGFVPVPNVTQPNYSNIMPSQIGAGYDSNAGWLNVLTSGLSSLLDGTKKTK
jgi:hypothetical protein